MLKYQNKTLSRNAQVGVVLLAQSGHSEGLAARGYSIPGGCEPEEVGWSGPGVPCRTLSDLDRGQAQNWSKMNQDQRKNMKINQSQDVEIWGCQF